MAAAAAAPCYLAVNQARDEQADTGLQRVVKPSETLLKYSVPFFYKVASIRIPFEKNVRILCIFFAIYKFDHSLLGRGAEEDRQHLPHNDQKLCPAIKTLQIVPTGMAALKIVPYSANLLVGD